MLIALVKVGFGGRTGSWGCPSWASA